MLKNEEVHALSLLAATNPDKDIQVAALDALTKLPIEPDALVNVSSIVRTVLEQISPLDAHSETLIDIASRIPVLSIHSSVVDIAQNADDPRSLKAALALAKHKDKSGLDTLLKELDGPDCEEIIERISCLELDEGTVDATVIEKLFIDSNPDIKFWAAIVLAKLGKLDAFDELWEEYVNGTATETAQMFWGDPWTPYNRIAAVRPIPEFFRAHLEELWEKSLAAIERSENSFFEESLPRDVNLIYWALTGVADAEGTSVVQESIDEIDTVPLPIEKGLSSFDREAAESVAIKLEVEPFVNADLPNATGEELETLPALTPQRAGDVMLSMLKHAGTADKEKIPPFMFGNAIVEVAGSIKHEIDLPVSELVQRYLKGEMYFPISQNQFMWLISRAGPSRVVNELSTLAETAKTDEETQNILYWISEIGEKFDAPAPYEGAGPDSGEQATEELVFIDDTEMKASPFEEAPASESSYLKFENVHGVLLDTGGVDEAEGTPATGSQRVAWPHLTFDDVIVFGMPFLLEVGISSARDKKLEGTGQLKLPVKDFELQIELMFDKTGFAIVDGERSFTLHVTKDHPFPKKTLTLVAIHNPELNNRRRIGATYLVEGAMKGYASRETIVTTSKDAVNVLDKAEQPKWSGMDLSPFDAAEEADFTILIKRGDDAAGNTLLFAAHSTVDSIPAPVDAPKSDIGEQPENFLREIIRTASTKQDGLDLFTWLRGRGKLIGDKLPKEIKQALFDVAEKLVPRQPTVLIITEDPYIPWELAVLDSALPGVVEEASPFLGSQVTMGRWILSSSKPPPNPPSEHEVKSKAVVSGVYDAVAGWNRLEEAEAEAADIAKNWPPTQEVNASLEDVLDYLEGRQDADVLHFALHGQFDPKGTQNGLVLIGREQGRAYAQIMEPDHIRGGELSRHSPFVFLNACQVGGGNQVLGDYAGLAAAFLYAGASAVVAPLWSINDSVARKVANGFYKDAYDKQIAPAEILRRERALVTKESVRNFVKGGAATHLGYQFFGHPKYLLKLL